MSECGATGIQLLRPLESWVSGAQCELSCRSSRLLHGLWVLFLLKFFADTAAEILPHFQTEAYGVVQIGIAIF